MRLICPKCDAQYDIADDVIPAGGRDVQCSNCAHTWLQTDKARVAGRPLTQRPTPRPAAPVTHASEQAGDDGPRHAPIVDAPTRKPLDSSIADILREEAAREKEIRATEEAGPHPSETPGQSPDARAEETRRRIAQMTDPAVTPAAIAAAATGAVHGANVGTVPGIDEINETLRARATASDASGLTEEEQYEKVQRRGFRRGFFFVLFLMALLIAPYFFVDQIVANLPQTTDIMATYVETVDGLRAWLNVQVQNIQAMIQDAMAGDEAPATAPETATPTTQVPATE